MLHPFRLVRRIVSLVVLAAAAYYVVTAFQVVTASRGVGAQGVGPHEAAVIVVGPGADGSGGALTPDLRLRLRHAASLIAAHRAPVVIVCDGTAAAVATDAAYLVSRGVSSGQIEKARAAELPGEMRLAAHRLRGRGGAIVVADSWQTLWVTHVAGAVGLRVVTSPITPADHATTAEAGAVVVQAAAVAWGRIAGFGQTGFIGG